MEFLSRQKQRELIFLVLYGLDHTDQELDNLIESLAGQVKLPKKFLQEAAQVAQSILLIKKDLDRIIEEISVGFALDRILKVELNLLRLALYEMMQQNLPHPVAISEAIRLARKFSTHESAKYLNAILDQFAKGLTV